MDWNAYLTRLFNAVAIVAAYKQGWNDQHYHLLKNKYTTVYM